MSSPVKAIGKVISGVGKAIGGVISGIGKFVKKAWPVLLIAGAIYFAPAVLAKFGPATTGWGGAAAVSAGGGGSAGVTLGPVLSSSAGTLGAAAAAGASTLAGPLAGGSEATAYPLAEQAAVPTGVPLGAPATPYALPAQPTIAAGAPLEATAPLTDAGALQQVSMQNYVSVTSNYPAGLQESVARDAVNAAVVEPTGNVANIRAGLNESIGASVQQGRPIDVAQLDAAVDKLATNKELFGAPSKGFFKTVGQKVGGAFDWMEDHPLLTVMAGSTLSRLAEKEPSRDWPGAFYGMTKSGETYTPREQTPSAPVEQPQTAAQQTLARQMTARLQPAKRMQRIPPPVAKGVETAETAPQITPQRQVKMRKDLWA